MKIIAHRGASAECPENTLSAFQRALEIGVDAIEADLLVTKESQLVVRHDDLIEKEGTWSYVHEFTFEELQRIDVGKGEKIPSLEAVFECLEGRVPLLLDLKAFGLAGLLAEFLRKRPFHPQLHVASFLHSEIYQFGKHFPDIERSIVLTALPPNAKAIFRDSQTQQVSLHRSFVTREIVQTLKGEGITVRVYSVNWPKEAGLFESWGVDAIFTDDPAAMQSFR